MGDGVKNLGTERVFPSLQGKIPLGARREDGSVDDAKWC